MEESASWKGHGFTLLVFGGIVVLCSIFFVLGMLVGRSQGQRMAENPASDRSVKPVPAMTAKPEEPNPISPTLDNAGDDRKPPQLEPQPTAKPEPPAADPPKVEAPPPTPANSTIFQVGAVRQSNDAEKLLNEVKGKGFPAFILMPSSGDANPLYRIQVGPYPSDGEAEIAQRKLESAGYKPFKK